MNLKKLISDSQSFASARVFTSSEEANKFLADHPEYRVVPNDQGVPDTSVSVALVNDAGFVSDSEDSLWEVLRQIKHPNIGKYLLHSDTVEAVSEEDAVKQVKSRDPEDARFYRAYPEEKLPEFEQEALDSYDE